MEHQALLRAAEAPDSETFVQWYENTKCQNNLSVKEAVDRLSQKELAAIWMVFHKWVKESVEQISNPEKQTEANHVLMVMSVMAIYSLDNVSSVQLQGLKPSILLINSVLKIITCKKTGKSICEVSEKFWKIHPEFEKNLAPEVIEWLVNSILDTKGTVTAVSLKYLWSLKDAVLKFNPITLENSSLMQTLLSCACNAKFVSNPDGRKFVACLFGLSPHIVQLLHQQFRKNIPFVTTAESEMFGEVYFRAWRHSPEHCRAEVESVIQDLMFCAVVAMRRPLGATEGGSNKVAMNKLLFHLLHAIHRQRKQRTVAVMIYNLYKPILWRFLEATNGLVRANALCLLFDAFPLESGEGLEEDEAVRNKQWEVTLTSLTDPDPLVRSIAVQGTCQILTEYWDLIPLNIIQDFIACMLRKLLYDSSSPAVRSSVVKGMCSMLDNKQTHALLEKMIPLTSKVLHDVNEKVRVEYVNLLIRIQSLRVSKLWEVIDMKHLIVRLAVDASKNVCRRLVVLLAPFYNPKSQPEVVLERCLRLVMDNRTASRKFYEHIHCCSDVQQIALVVLIIWKFLRNYCLKQLQQNRTGSDREIASSSNRARGSKRSRRIEPSDAQRHPDEDKENQDMSSDSENDTADDDGVNAEEEIGESTILGLIDVLCILLSNNKSKMKTPQNLVYWKNIQHRFTKSCSLFFRYFRNSNGLRSIIYMYGLLSSNSSPIMLTFVKSQLKSLNDDASRSEFAHLLDALCNWGRGDDILEFVAENIQRGMTSLQPPAKSTQKTRGTRKSVQFKSANEDDKPILGLRCMLYVLQNVNNKKVIFRQNLTQVEDVANLLKPLMSLIENRRELLSIDNQFIIEATVLFVKLVCVLTSAHKRLDSSEGQVKFTAFREQVVEILNWIERLLESETPTDGLRTLVCSILTTINNMLMIHSAGSDICHQLLSVVNRMVDLFSCSSKALVLSMTTAYLILDFIWVERTVGQDDDLFKQSEQDLNLLMKKTLSYCSEESDDLSFTPDEYVTMRDTIREILTLCHRHSSPEHPSLAEMVRITVTTMETEMNQFVQNPECDTKGVKDLPTMTQTITLAFRARNKVARMVLQNLLDSLDQRPKESILQFYLGTVKLLRTLSQDQGKISTASLVDIVNQIDQLWSRLEDKDSNEEVSKSIANLLKETKIVLRID